MLRLMTAPLPRHRYDLQLGYRRLDRIVASDPSFLVSAESQHIRLWTSRLLLMLLSSVQPDALVALYDEQDKFAALYCMDGL